MRDEASGRGPQRGYEIGVRLPILREAPLDEPSMFKIVWIVAATLGGALGWWLGTIVGLMTGVVLSAVGTAAGVYAARRFQAQYE
jgi:membrane protein YqaA with SNARE-associated domain